MAKSLIAISFNPTGYLYIKSTLESYLSMIGENAK